MKTPDHYITSQALSAYFESGQIQRSDIWCEAFEMGFKLAEQMANEKEAARLNCKHAEITTIFENSECINCGKLFTK